MLSEIEFKDMVDHANFWNTDFSKPYNVIIYCSEKISKISFSLTLSITKGEEKENLLEKLTFLNGTLGRITFLEEKTETKNCRDYLRFNEDSGENQVDIFLKEIGYGIIIRENNFSMYDFMDGKNPYRKDGSKNPFRKG